MCKYRSAHSQLVVQGSPRVTLYAHLTATPITTAVDCQTEWSEWSPCSQTCGTGGTSFRVKRIVTTANNGGKQCPSPMPREDRSCNQEACPAANDCQMGQWTEWSVCDAQCTRTRNRKVVRDAQNGGLLSELTTVVPTTTHRHLRNSEADPVLQWRKVYAG
jgi:hypothetical protein